MMNDKEIMRAYVTGADHLQYTQLADGMVQVRIEVRARTSRALFGQL